MCPALDAGTAVAVPLLQYQLLVCLFDQDLEEPALCFQTGLMNVRLDLVGEILVLRRHGKGHLQRQFEGECLIVTIDGAEGDGSLEAVRSTHGVSPYLNYGDPSCVLSYQSDQEVRYPRRDLPQRMTYPNLRILP